MCLTRHALGGILSHYTGRPHKYCATRTIYLQARLRRDKRQAMECCRTCGVDVGGRNKNRHPLFGKDICPTLTGFATDAVKSLSVSSPQGSELLLDVQTFQSGYVCRGCYRELVKLHSLQKQLSDTKESISNKLAQISHLLPTKPIGRSPSTCQHGLASKATSYLSPRAHRKRPGIDLSSNAERIKRRRTLDVAKSVPSTSTNSPDVAVSLIIELLT